MKKISASIIFNFIAVAIVGVSIFLYIEFSKTKQNITSIYKSEHIQYVKQFTNNLNQLIISTIKDNNIYETLSHDKHIVEELENNLNLFISNRYKYIYVLQKEDNEYRFLLDGTKEEVDKSEFEEIYTPLMPKKFDFVYKTKKSLFFSHKRIKSLWMTALVPIIIDDNVIAITVVDFSMKNLETMTNSLNYFNYFFKKVIIFSIVIFLIIIWFSRLDRKREILKNQAFTNLQLQTKKLEEQTQKTQILNTTLEQRVKEEVEKNRKKDQQIVQQSRLAQMGEMLSMIAHQWRQPLAAISSVSASLELKAQLGTIDTTVVLERSQKISAYSQHLSSTIDDFRDFFKPEKRISQTSFNEIILSVLNIIQTPIENKNITIIQDLENSANFFSYPNELKQVVLNLFKNAEEALLENDVKDPYIKITTEFIDNCHILKVYDNAGGIPQEILEKIFDPYFSTKMEKNGSGLGLYMSKTIIEEHCEGTISVLNSDEGAVFSVALPERQA